MNNIKEIMSRVNGASFVGITTSTEPKLLGGKKNPFIGHTRKITVGASVMVFQNKTKNGYNEMVKRRLIKEGKNPESFELSPRAWGTRLEGIPFVEHNGQYYLEVIFLSTGKSHYEVDGIITPADRIEGLTGRGEEGRQGGLEDKVVIRTFKVSSITSLTVNKETFDGPFEFK